MLTSFSAKEAPKEKKKLARKKHGDDKRIPSDLKGLAKRSCKLKGLKVGKKKKKGPAETR